MLEWLSESFELFGKKRPKPAVELQLLKDKRKKVVSYQSASGSVAVGESVSSGGSNERAMSVQPAAAAHVRNHVPAKLLESKSPVADPEDPVLLSNGRGKLPKPPRAIDYGAEYETLNPQVLPFVSERDFNYDYVRKLLSEAITAAKTEEEEARPARRRVSLDSYVITSVLMAMIVDPKYKCHLRRISWFLIQDQQYAPRLSLEQVKSLAEHLPPNLEIHSELARYKMGPSPQLVVAEKAEEVRLNVLDPGAIRRFLGQVTKDKDRNEWPELIHEAMLKIIRENRPLDRLVAIQDFVESNIKAKNILNPIQETTLSNSLEKLIHRLTAAKQSPKPAASIVSKFSEIITEEPRDFDQSMRDTLIRATANIPIEYQSAAIFKCMNSLLVKYAGDRDRILRMDAFIELKGRFMQTLSPEHYESLQTLAAAQVEALPPPQQEEEDALLPQAAV